MVKDVEDVEVVDTKEVEVGQDAAGSNKECEKAISTPTFEFGDYLVLLIPFFEDTVHYIPKLLLIFFGL